MRRPIPLLAALVLIACSKGADGSHDSGNHAGCSSLRDCSGNQVCLNSTCVDICHSSAECKAGTACEEGVCLAPACGNDSDCGSGQACLDGKCAQAPVGSQVASCDVTPNPGDVRVGSTLQMTVIPRDSDGNVLHFSGATWAASGGNTVSTDGVLSAKAAGDITVTATAGTKTCSSTVHAYGSVASGSLRVTAINMHTKEPIAGAKVIVCNGSGTCAAAITTAGDGTATASADTSNDVHVFAPGYNYTSFVQTTATDLLVPLQPYIATSARSGFTSHLCQSRTDDPNTGDATKPQCQSPEGEFAPLQDQGEAVHLAFFGSSVPNSLLDLSLSTLVGPMHSVPIAITGVGSKTLDLPYGLVLGIGTNFFGTNDPRVFADGGLRSLWGIGGNVNITKVITVLTPLFAPNATIDVGTLLPQLLGFFGRFQAGAVVGVKAPPNSGAPTFVDRPVQLTTPMRLRYDVSTAPLPQLDGQYVDGVIAVAGAMNYPLGFVPLGLSAGLSAKDGQGGVTDATCDTACTKNLLHLKFAPENGGSEGSPAAVALLALNFGGLTPGSTSKVAISGQVNLIPNNQLVYTSPDKPAPAIPPAGAQPTPFMKLPASSSILVTAQTRNVQITGDADQGAQIYRFELANAARLNWAVWVPKIGTQKSFHMPDPGFSATLDCNPMTTLCDPFAQANADDGTPHGPAARLLALQLRTPDTAAQLETFGNALRLDELGTSLKAFTALQVDVNP